VQDESDGHRPRTRTGNALPVVFSRLVLNFHICVLSGSGCSQSLRGIGYSSVVIAAQYEVLLFQNAL